MNRDSRWWFVMIIGGVAAFVASHKEKFPFIPADYQGLVELVAFTSTLVGGLLGQSPLPHSTNPGAPAFDAKKLIGK
jgi:hypothetical protein